MSLTPVWLARVDDATLNDTIFYEILHYFTKDEQKYVRKYVFPDDQRRSLLGKLLQYALISSTFQCSSRDFYIKRTKENKPYPLLKYVSAMLSKPYWNYNLSHHGNFVGIVADENHLVGLDIVDVTTRTIGVANATSYVDIFTSQLTQCEKRVILSEKTEDSKYEQFFLYWCLKESFIKAIGLGLGFDLLRVEFTVYREVCKARMSGEDVWMEGYAKAKIDGVEREDWR
ncbi:4'-phosphopantetheinyl transferase superfamily protein [archaeon]|nr:MAG: 4'-phosphopantetheinyl transferase superfamily protein [archaeon]